MVPDELSDAVPESAASRSPSRDAVAHALVQGLLAHDPRLPRVALATIRALRRAESAHVDRVSATVDALRSIALGAGSTADRANRAAGVLADLAPFERAASVRLLEQSLTLAEVAAPAPDPAVASNPSPAPPASIRVAPRAPRTIRARR